MGTTRKTSRRIWSLRRTFLLSLLVHVLTPIGIGRCDPARDWLGAKEIDTPLPALDPLVFEFVEPTPGPEAESVPATRFVSTKKSLARSEPSETPLDAENDRPRSEGASPLMESAREELRAEEPGAGTAAEEPAEEPEGLRTRPLALSPSEIRRDVVRSLERRSFDNKRGTAKIPGDLSFHTVDFEFAPYLLALKTRIEEKWYPPVAFRGGLPYGGDTVARFIIERDGTLGGLEALKNADHPSLDVAALNAIRYAAPFPPLPEGFPEERWVITCTFYYR
jgi:TonB family protein